MIAIPLLVCAIAAGCLGNLDAPPETLVTLADRLECDMLYPDNSTVDCEEDQHALVTETEPPFGWICWQALFTGSGEVWTYWTDLEGSWGILYDVEINPAVETIYGFTAFGEGEEFGVSLFKGPKHGFVRVPYVYDETPELLWFYYRQFETWGEPAELFKEENLEIRGTVYDGVHPWYIAVFEYEGETLYFETNMGLSLFEDWIPQGAKWEGADHEGYLRVGVSNTHGGMSGVPLTPSCASALLRTGDGPLPAVQMEDLVSGQETGSAQPY